jgi:hypothetical protein
LVDPQSVKRDEIAGDPDVIDIASFADAPADGNGDAFN